MNLSEFQGITDFPQLPQYSTFLKNILYSAPDTSTPGELLKWDDAYKHVGPSAVKASTIEERLQIVDKIRQARSPSKAYFVLLMQTLLDWTSLCMSQALEDNHMKTIEHYNQELEKAAGQDFNALKMRYKNLKTFSAGLQYNTTGFKAVSVLVKSIEACPENPELINTVFMRRDATIGKLIDGLNEAVQARREITTSMFKVSGGNYKIITNDLLVSSVETASIVIDKRGLTTVDGDFSLNPKTDAGYRTNEYGERKPYYFQDDWVSSENRNHIFRACVAWNLFGAAEFWLARKPKVNYTQLDFDKFFGLDVDEEELFNKDYTHTLTLTPNNFDRLVAVLSSNPRPKRETRFLDVPEDEQEWAARSHTHYEHEEETNLKWIIIPGAIGVALYALMKL